MKTSLNIGLVIADDMEYKDLTDFMGNAMKKNNFYGRTGHTFLFRSGNKTITVNAIHCGIGTVNATAAAMYLVEKGADILLNYGLSGGISGVSRGEDVIATSFIEYDFDLVCCGYKMCEKPSQKYIYSADQRLVDLLKNTGSVKKCGKMASGDKFVSDGKLKEQLKTNFGINCCDMETSAIAYVGDLTGTPVASLRRVSDDAGDDAISDYREMNSSAQLGLPEQLILAIKGIFDVESFWE